ncbi:hypothetical protein [Streptomyces sp. NPDC047315]|uniref:hypothetical protein n=1 Tax=Streptomyces sp. NPDC047315 TaxID=3155142 RepID=UPI003409331E
MEYEITTPVAGFRGEVAGVTFTDERGRTSDPGAVAYFRRHGYGVDEAAGEQPERLERPAKSASKADWAAYAVAQGMVQADAEAMTRDDLAAKYAEGGSGNAGGQ